MKLCSFDARSKGQPWPLLLREGIRNRTALPAVSLEDSLSRRSHGESCRIHRASESPQADKNDDPTRPQPMATPETYPLGYVEDYFDPRTKLGTVFSILLRFGAAEARITIARLG